MKVIKLERTKPKLNMKSFKDDISSKIRGEGPPMSHRNNSNMKLNSLYEIKFPLLNYHAMTE